MIVHLFYGKPNDLVRQSIPFAYFYLDINSTDGSTHDVRVYSDITPRKSSHPFLFELYWSLQVEWLHGNEVLIDDPSPKVNANASLIDSSDFVGLQMQLQAPQPFTEIANHAQDVTGVFAMKLASKSVLKFARSSCWEIIQQSSNVKYQVGTDVAVRALGITSNSTGLQNTVDGNYSAHALDRSVYSNIVLIIHIDVYAIPKARLTHMQSQWTSVPFRAPRSRSCTPSGCFATRPLILQRHRDRTSSEVHSIGRISAQSRKSFANLLFMSCTYLDIYF